MKSKLVINPTSFNENVWQDSHIDFTQEEYNVWLQNAEKHLQEIYDICEDNDKIDVGSLYILGDIINMLTNTEIIISKK